MKIQELNIAAFRGLKNAKLSELSRINYVVGGNNSGKTSVLESIVTGGCYSDVNMLTDTVFARSQKRFLEGAKNMLIPRDSEKTSITVKFDDGHFVSTEVACSETEKIVQNDKGIQNNKQLTVNFECIDNVGESQTNSSFWINFEQTGKNTILRKDPSISQKNLRSIPCQFVSFSRFDSTDKIIQALDTIFVNNQRDALLKVLQIFEPDVINFEVIGEERLILVFKNGLERNSSLYLNDYGNGMYKAFYIACAAILSENGILLLDELEAGIHHKALKEFVVYLDKVSKERNIQMIITTHSLELLDIAAHIHDDNSMNVYNIRNRENGIGTSVKLLKRNEFDYLREELGVDVR